MKNNWLSYPILFLVILTFISGCKKEEEEPTPIEDNTPNWINERYIKYMIGGSNYIYDGLLNYIEQYPAQDHQTDGAGNTTYRYGTYFRNNTYNGHKVGVFLTYYKNGMLTDAEFDALVTSGYKSYVAPNATNPYGIEIKYGSGDALPEGQYSSRNQPGTQIDNYFEIVGSAIHTEGGYRKAILKIRFACNVYKPGATPNSYYLTNGSGVIAIPMMN